MCFACAQREGVTLEGGVRSAGGDKRPWRETFVDVVLQPHLTLKGEVDGRTTSLLATAWLWTFVGLGAAWAWLYLLRPDAVFAALEASAAQSDVTLDPALLRATPWLGLPFIATLRLGLGAVTLHMGLRLSGAPGESFREHGRLFALTSITLLLCVIPLIGPLFALVAWVGAVRAYTRHRYAFGTVRAVLATLPSMLLFSVTDPIFLVFG